MSKITIPEFKKGSKTLTEAFGISSEREEHLKVQSIEDVSAAMEENPTIATILESFIRHAETETELVYQSYLAGRLIQALQPDESASVRMSKLMMSVKSRLTELEKEMSNKPKDA
jgi:hypothetical protein